MDGYMALRSRVTKFLKDNPEVQLVTLKRPDQTPRTIYSNSNNECYGRVPETCPVLRAILEELLPDSLQINRADGTPVDLDDFRNDIFLRVHDQITAKFRSALEEVCEQKHDLLRHVRATQIEMREWIEQAETEAPEAPKPAPKTRGSSEVEFEIDEESSY